MAMGVMLIMTVAGTVKVGVGVQVAVGAFAAAIISMDFRHSHFQTGTHQHRYGGYPTDTCFEQNRMQN